MRASCFPWLLRYSPDVMSRGHAPASRKFQRRQPSEGEQARRKAWAHRMNQLRKALKA